MYRNSKKKRPIFYRSYMKNITQITNMEPSLPPFYKQQPSAYQPKQEPNVKFIGSQKH